MTSAEARRLALAVTRLREGGDWQGMRLLLAEMDAVTLRQVVVAQTENVSVLLEGLFTTIAESHLPLLAVLHGLPRDQVVADHLERLITGLALSETEEP